MNASFHRSLTLYLKQNLNVFNKMVWVAGPRQVGKTTLLQSWPQTFGFERSFYLNWDIPEDRKILTAPELSFFREKILAGAVLPFFLLDEIHKYSRWKNFLKGLYDALKDKARFAVTGSARLDIYRRGGDSLLGRYWLFHLYPLTIAEVLGKTNFSLPKNWNEESNTQLNDAYNELFQKGGFPEPFFRLDVAGHARWAALRKEILMREDLRDLSRIQELALVENLMDLLPTKVGSPLSINSLREDLEISHPTLTRWLLWLEKLYYCFFIPVYSKHKGRSLKKEKKVYLYDWAEVKDQGARFENLVALHLRKAIHLYREFSGENLRLFYLRDKEKREVDFLILRDTKPWMLIECKWTPDFTPSSLVYYSQRLKPQHTVLLTHEKIDPQWKIFRDTSYWLSPASTFLANWV